MGSISTEPINYPICRLIVQLTRSAFAVSGWTQSGMGAGSGNLESLQKVGYGGFLWGPPLFGSLSLVIGLRFAMIAIALAGLAFTAGPIFIQLIEPSSEETQEPWIKA
jgi:hypothetical protein